MYDLIGDVHGHYDELVSLLQRLEYREDGSGTYAHAAGRQVIFLGDYIDRGPKIRETLHLVRQMVAHGTAIALMGNHEFNALAFATPNPQGGYLRSHNAVHTHQHQATLAAFAGSPALQAEWQGFLSWFYTLPLWLELSADLRAVHACWNTPSLSYLRHHLPNACLTPEFLQQAATRNTPAYDAVEITLKGREISLPNGLTFQDKDGHTRDKSRVKWWLDPAQTTCDDYYFAAPPTLNGVPVDIATLLDSSFYQDSTPIFFGHYWLEGEPQLLGAHTVCLDYSVAKNGKLVGYRWHGEQHLRPDGLLWV